MFTLNYDEALLKYVFIFTFLWGIAMLIFNSIIKNKLETEKINSINMRENEIINELINHNELYFHLTLIAFYIIFIVLGFIYLKNKDI